MLIQDQIQSQQQRIDPKLILANAILQLSCMELQQTIEQELAENPALEMEEDGPCVGCELAPFACKDCQHSKQRPRETSLVEQRQSDTDAAFDITADPADQGDPMDRVQAEVTLQEHLRTQLGNVTSGKLHEIGDYLINYINESGYLGCDLLEITLELDASDEQLAEAVSIIQTLDPPGIGARDLQECMLIQLRCLAEDGLGNPIAERMILDCWRDLKARKFARIARMLKIKPEQVRQAAQFIQTKLNPYPAAGFRAPWDYKPTDAKNAIRPDVVLRRTPNGYEIEIIAGDYLSLAVNPYYRQMYTEMRNNGHTVQQSVQDKKHIIEYVERADQFIRNLDQRRKVLRNVTKCIVEMQHGFLETGSKLFMRSLTRVKIAKMLSLHESTVSRAIANKYIQLPNQEVLPFNFFFQSSPSIADMVVQMIANEDSAHPLSDQQIADFLTGKGHQVARRTVVKYREAQKILSSRQRRRR